MKCAGLITQLREFFKANPDEELTFEDAREKFSATVENLRSSLYILRQRGEMEIVIRPKRNAP